MFLQKYGVARHIYIPIPKAGSANHSVSADWTPSAGDVKISKDGGAAANVTNLPTAIAMGNSTIWDFSITATELQAAQVMVTVADSATKAVDDTGFIIETYGNASGQHAFDFATATQKVDLDTIKTQAVTAAAGVTFPTSIASPTNITAGTITTVTTVTNQLTAAAIATGIWQDTTAGDFTTALSVGKSIMNGVSLGTGLTIAAVSGTVGSVTGAVGSVTGAVGSVTGNVGGNVVGSVASVTAGVTIANGGFGASSASAAGLNAIADGVLDRNMATGADSGTELIRTPRQAMRTLRNKVDTTLGNVYKEDDSTASFTFAVTTAAGNPITVFDPT